MGLRGLKKFGRRLRNTARKARKIVGGGARTMKTILGAADKLSGGAATRALQMDPRTSHVLKPDFKVGRNEGISITKIICSAINI